MTMMKRTLCIVGCLFIHSRHRLFVAAITNQVFPTLFDNEIIGDATLLDDETQNLYITSNPEGFTANAFSLYRINAEGNRDYKVQIPFRDGIRFESPTDIKLYAPDTLVVLANGGFSDPTISGGGDCAVYLVNSEDGTVFESLLLNGPEYIENGQTNSLITCRKAIVSAQDPTKIYVMAVSLMNIDAAAYGYSTFKIDVPTGTVDWVDHYLPASYPDGGSPEDILEVDASYLLVGGFMGLYRYELDTGARSGVLPSKRVNNLLQVNDQVLVGGAGSDSSVALDVTTLSLVWDTPEGRGIVYYKPGPNSDPSLVWYTKILIPEASQNWNVEVGVISLLDGSEVWKEEYDGGSNDFDTVVGFSSIRGTSIAYLGTSGRQQGGGCCFGNLWGFLPRIVGFLGLSASGYSLIIGDARLLTVDHTTMSIQEDPLIDTAIGAPATFLGTDNIGWMLGYDGGGILYHYD